MKTDSETGPGVREDRRTGQFVPTVDGKDVSPSSFDRQRAMAIAQGHWLTKSQPAPTVAHTSTPWKLSGNLIYDGYGHKVLAKACSLADFNEQDANGAFIVQAVNSHQALIEACEAANRLLTHSVSEQVESTWLELPNHAETLRLVRTALHLAKGEAHQ